MTLIVPCRNATPGKIATVADEEPLLLLSPPLPYPALPAEIRSRPSICTRRPDHRGPPAGRVVRSGFGPGRQLDELNECLGVFLDLGRALVLVALAVVASSIRIAKEYERGVVFRLGRMIPLKGPGLFLIVPFGIDRVRMVDLRVITLEVPPQEVLTSDNVTVKVNAVIFFQVMDAQSAIIRVYNFAEATSQIAQTTLRAVLGQSSLDELLGMRDKINATLQSIIDRHTESWGIKVRTVELKDVQLPARRRALVGFHAHRVAGAHEAHIWIRCAWLSEVLTQDDPPCHPHRTRPRATHLGSADFFRGIGRLWLSDYVHYPLWVGNS